MAVTSALQEIVMLCFFAKLGVFATAGQHPCRHYASAGLSSIICALSRSELTRPGPWNVLLQPVGGASFGAVFVCHFPIDGICARGYNGQESWLLYFSYHGICTGDCMNPWVEGQDTGIEDTSYHPVTSSHMLFSSLVSAASFLLHRL